MAFGLLLSNQFSWLSSRSPKNGPKKMDTEEHKVEQSIEMDVPFNRILSEAQTKQNFTEKYEQYKKLSKALYNTNPFTEDNQDQHGDDEWVMLPDKPPQSISGFLDCCFTWTRWRKKFLQYWVVLEENLLLFYLTKVRFSRTTSLHNISSQFFFVY
jgi:hypothetical protein